MMRIRIFFALLITLFSAALIAQENIKVLEVKGIRTAITPKLSTWKPDPTDPVLKIKTRDEKGLIFSRTMQPFKMINYHNGSTGPDPLWQQRSGIPALQSINTSTPTAKNSTTTGTTKRTIISNSTAAPELAFDGIPFTSISPADPTIAVGPNHIIQMVNGSNGSAYFKIFNKSGGQLSLEAFMDQLPGASYNGAGDCITWYDQLTNRFVMSEFGDSSRTGTAVNSLIMAVSASPDPLGAWYVYEFADASFFPDYPKYANWNNAWFGMTRDFNGAYLGNSVWAFDKTKMINGDPVVTVQRIRITDPDNKFNSLCPVSLAGTTPPPPGSPGLFQYFSDDDFTASPSDTDSIGLIGFSVDFSDPSKSKVGKIQSIPVAAFRSNVCTSRNCAPSASGQGYDVVSNRMMNRPYYRNFGTYEAIVANHTVDASGTGVAGLRWYELRKTGAAWSNYQQSTFGPQDIIPCVDPAARFRFMGAITLNRFGQIGLAYNTSSATSFASIAFTGRNPNDPLNAMSYEETMAMAGTGFGSFGNRWGDYSEITSDPVDDSLFWFSGMYGTPNGWGTKIISFKLGQTKQKDVKLVSIDKPNACENSCTNNVEPLITIRNAGITLISSLQFSYQVDGNTPVIFDWSGNLTTGEETQIKFPATVFATGTGSFKVEILKINGVAGDDDNSNNLLVTATSIGVGVTLPITEGFENVLFPSVGWSIRNNMNPIANWERNTNASRSGTASVYFNNFDQNQPSRYADLLSPMIKLDGKDSLELTLSYAAVAYDIDNVDTLEILVSEDCGNNFKSVWRKNAREIATRAGNINTAFIPKANEWAKLTIDLNAFAKASNLIIAFRNINGFGNMIYLDDINIKSADLPAKDIAVSRIIEPAPYICTNQVKPTIAFTNLGKDTITDASFMYSINGDVFRTASWKGKLGRKEVATIVLPETSLSPGDHTITVWANLTGDSNGANDSLKTSFQVKAPVGLPLVQNFDAISYPPGQWNLVNEGGNIEWEKFEIGAAGSQSSSYIKNYQNRNIGERDQLVTPLMSYVNADSVFMEFKLAAAGGLNGTDTLMVLVSTDCGKTLIPVYKKWGKRLQTISDAQLAIVDEFIPTSESDWRNEKIDLGSVLGSSNSFVALFSNTSNGVNNIYIDEVNVFIRQVAEKLKSKGLMITPNPFSGRFVIQHYPDAKGLTGIEIFTGTGQRVYSKKATEADKYVEIDLSGKPAGIYFVKISYKDKLVTEKLLKGY